MKILEILYGSKYNCKPHPKFPFHCFEITFSYLNAKQFLSFYLYRLKEILKRISNTPILWFLGP